MRDVWKDIIELAGMAVTKAGLACSVHETHPGMFDAPVSAGGSEIGSLSLTFRQDRFDAILWDRDGHITGGSSGIGYGRVDDRLWVLADIERALRLSAVGHGILPARELPSDFVLDVVVHDVARLPQPWEEPHAWAAAGPQAPSVVREARDIVSSGRFDRERCLRFARSLAEAVPNLDHRRDGSGFLMMAKRCVAAFEGRTVLPIHEHQWRSRATARAFPIHDPEIVGAEMEAEAPTASPSP